MATSTSTVNHGTQRTDNWRLAPTLTFLGFALFIVYATFRAFMNDWFTGTPVDQYLSPLYSPYLPEWAHALGLHWTGAIAHTPHGMPEGLGWIISPALLILWAPAGFRTTCYYYRKAYYRSFFTAPVACAVDSKAKSPLIALLGTGRKYTGERVFPLVLQNMHRYFFYIAAGFIMLLGWDALAAFFMVDTNLPAAQQGWNGLYLGLGNLVMVINVILLSLYTFGCHSWRHLLGGKLDCWSSCGMVGEARQHAWQRQSILNEHHMEFAWLSLFSVGFTDLYIFLVSKGIWVDPHMAWTWKQLFGS